MMFSGSYLLGDFSVTAAGSYEGDPVLRLGGMREVTVQMRFAYGSGGTVIKAFLQTSLDQGNTWVDIWHCFFGILPETRLMTFSKSLPPSAPITPGDGVLDEDEFVQGVLGDRLRVRLITSGLYGGVTTVSVRASPS